MQCKSSAYGVCGYDATMLGHPLESPWALVVVLLVVAAVLRTAGQRGALTGAVVLNVSGRRLLNAAAATAVLLALGCWLAATWVETPKEAVERAVRELVSATGPFDAAAFDALVSDDAEVLGPDGSVMMGMPQVRSALARVRSAEHRVITLSAEVEHDHRGTAYLELRTRWTETGALPYLTHWRITWEHAAPSSGVPGSDGPWRAVRMEWLPSSPFRLDGEVANQFREARP